MYGLVSAKHLCDSTSTQFSFCFAVRREWLYLELKGLRIFFDYCCSEESWHIPDATASELFIKLVLIACKRPKTSFPVSNVQ